MIIRKATVNDLEAMLAIYNQAVAAGQKTADIIPITLNSFKNWFKEHRPEKYPILVAEHESEILGYASISPYRPGRLALQHTAEVSYYVHFNFHRRGIASGLLKHAIQICPSLQIKTLFAILLDSNRASLQLLQKFGFKKWGHLPRVAVFDEIEVGHLYYGLRVVE